MRAIKDLASLNDAQFFAAVSQGFELLLAHAGRLEESVPSLINGNHFHAAKIIANHAEEEAAKCLILMDAVRCPREPKDRLFNHLGRYYCHLAKGIYAMAHWMQPSSLEQFQLYVDMYRKEYYLDGWAGPEYIFYNEIRRSRDDVLYVDYVARDGEYFWESPRVQDECLIPWPYQPSPLSISRLLHDAGWTSAPTLSLIASLWRPAKLDLATQWNVIFELNQQTSDLIEKNGLLKDAAANASVVNKWQFPMYALDLTLDKVKPEVLRDKRDSYY